ncbi:MAG: DNA-directed RNA polymerase subunit beta' [bacterium]|nr:DNA-directed RNA polymerase subunit beta' [bacterium]
MDNNDISDDDIFSFSGISISLASPEKIRSWSYGEIRKPETINYRTFRPERGGLFCERIFGPTRDWECFCGKFKSIRYKGVVCDRCGVEVTRSEVRRHRMGHINLVSPVSHIWYFKRIPSPMAILLDMSISDLEKILYYENYVVISPGNTGLSPGQILTEKEYEEYKENYKEGFKAGMGAEAVKELLKSIDLHKLQRDLSSQIKKEDSNQKRRKYIRHLQIVESFLNSGTDPSWMILDVIPVIPPELRPMVQLDGGRFATSDLNDLYRRVINRNNRLQRLMELHAPEIIIRNEKRMLQEAVDALFDNGRRGRVVKGAGNRPLKSLSDMLKGKQGRFRQNLLGKRVDYSGRSVIVVGPELRLHQCGLPKRMALELFKPFIMQKLVMSGRVHNIKSAKRMVERGDVEIWDILEEVISEHPILLNRAPTLHRAGIQAFEPVLVEGDAIHIHPLVCTAFNADFDGDQMAAHVPLSIESQLESRLLMLSSHNLLSPAHGEPLVTPTQDMDLGICYLTKEKKGAKGEGKRFSSIDEALAAYDSGFVDLHARVIVPIDGKKTETTIGRIIFNNTLLEEMEFINEMMDKKAISKMISTCYRKYGVCKTVTLLDNIKRLGFEYATRFGASIGIDDMKIPRKKEELLKESQREAEEITRQYQQGIITNEERYNRLVDLWTHVGEEISEVMFEELSQDSDGFNPLYLMVISGARGSKQQTRQLAGMRGLMARPSGEIIELPITSNFREGLSVLEYFISTHGARKGLADTALKTADAGYLTRRLVDVAQEIVVREYDCGTINGIVVEAIKEGDEVIEPLRDRILGRVALEDVVDLMTGEVLVKANSEITEEEVSKIERAEIEKVKIRTVLTCEAKYGVCSKCYGWDLATGKLVNIGETVGIIAAQSIGEPGTQLTMRTFHIGGTAFRQVEEREIKLPYKYEIIETPKHLINLSDKASIAVRSGELKVRRVLAEYNVSSPEKIRVFDGLWVNSGDEIVEGVTSQVSGVARIDEEKGIIYIMAKERTIPIKIGTQIRVKQGDIVSPGDIIAEFDPYNEPILTEVSGKIKFKDIIKGKTMREEVDENTGLFKRVIIEDREGKFQPEIIVVAEDGKHSASYILPHGARIVVNDEAKVSAGDVLAKFPQEFLKTKDITGGLPRVAELFEARHLKDKAVVTEIDGRVHFKGTSGGIRIIQVKNEATGDEKEYHVSVGKHLKVHEGDEVLAGDQLTEGPVDPHDILRIKGDKKLQEYLVNEIQEVYRLQGVIINDKHIEAIIRQMLKKVQITDVGDTNFLLGEKVNKTRFQEENERVIKSSGRPAKARPILLGITKASLSTESFISAASFQETTRVLSEAAIKGKVDKLRGLKENVIIGSLIPAGTGLAKRRRISIYSKEEPVGEDADN